MKKGGGPAFPRPMGETEGMSDGGAEGMTLRDWFAGQALVGLMAMPQVVLEPAKDAYRIADEMLRESGRNIDNWPYD